MIIITTPTGAIGHQVLENVLRGEEPIRVIARDPARLPSHVRERIDVVEGSHSDPTVVNKAFAGADTVFWLVPPDPRAKTVEAASCRLHAAGMRRLQRLRESSEAVHESRRWAGVRRSPHTPVS